MKIKKEYERWLANAVADTDVAAELKAMDYVEVEDAFYRDLAFGTGGLRGVIGAGTNRMNIYTVAKASQGLADYLKKHFKEPSVAIGYDSRIKSDVFAKVAAGVFTANGVSVNIWPVLMPVPTVSFATRYLHTSAGVLTAVRSRPKQRRRFLPRLKNLTSLRMSRPVILKLAWQTAASGIFRTRFTLHL